MLRCLFLCACLGLIPMAGNATADDPKAKTPESALEGAWTLTSLEDNGDKVSEEVLTSASMVMKGNKYTFKMLDDKMQLQTEEGTLKVDAAKKPATIDLDISSGESKGKKQLGIYQLDGQR